MKTKNFSALEKWVKDNMQNILSYEFMDLILVDEDFRVQYYNALQNQFNLNEEDMIKLYGIFASMQVQPPFKREYFLLTQLNNVFNINLQVTQYSNKVRI